MKRLEIPRRLKVCQKPEEGREFPAGTLWFPLTIMLFGV